MEVGKQLENICLYIVLAWVAVMLYNGQLRWLSKEAGIEANRLSTDFIFYAGLVFIISRIQRGVEIRAENELTV